MTMIYVSYSSGMPGYSPEGIEYSAFYTRRALRDFILSELYLTQGAGFRLARDDDARRGYKRLAARYAAALWTHRKRGASCVIYMYPTYSEYGSWLHQITTLTRAEYLEWSRLDRL